MKVVLFCGGQGLRIREASQTVPKPMIPLGEVPLLLHLMRYYAHFGHTEFILCLGYGARAIKDHFLNFKEAHLNDFVLSHGGRSVEMLHSDIEDWRITFVDTGIHSSIGQRLKAVREHVGQDELFLANYADGLTDAPLPQLIGRLRASGKTGLFLAVKPHYTFHLVSFDGDGLVRRISPMSGEDMWLNGGFFVFRRGIFDYIATGEDLVEKPFRRLIAEQQLLAYPYQGFWAAMDTLKDHQMLESLHESGQAPWAVWKNAWRRTRETDCSRQSQELART